MAGQTVQVSVLADTKNFSSAMKGVGSSTDGLLGKFKGLAIGVGAALGAAKIADWAGDQIKSLARIDQINQQTASAIKATGGAAQVSSQHIQNLAGSLENHTATEAESIQEGANLLLTFKGIQNQAGKGNDIFDQTTKTLVDMSRAMGTEPKAAAIQLGKALNDPTKGLTALTRVGVTFTDQQKSQIESMQKTGDVAGAQKIILAELNSEFGGSGAAYAKSYQGQIDLLGHAFGTFGETLLSGVMPALGTTVGGLAKFLNKISEAGGPVDTLSKAIGSGLSKGLSVIGGLFSDVGTAVGPLSQSFAPLLPALIGVVTAFSPLGIVLQALLPVLPVLTAALAQTGAVLAGALAQALIALAPVIIGVTQAVVAFIVPILSSKDAVLTIVGALIAVKAGMLAFQAVQGVMTAFATVTKVAAAAQVLFNLALAANPIGIVIAVIAALVAGLIFFFTQTKVGQQIWANFTKFLGEAWTNVVNFIKTAITVLQVAINVAFNAISSVIRTVWSGIVSFVTTYVNALKTVITNVIAAIATGIRTYVEIWSSIFRAGFQTIQAVVGAAINVVKTVIETGLAVVKAIFSGNWGAIPGIISGAVGRVSGIVRGLVSNVTGIIRGLAGNITGAVGNFGSLLLSAGRNIVEGLINGVKGMIGAAVSTVRDLAANVVNAAKGALGIHSPSTVFKEIGQNTGQGFINGVLGKSNEIDSAVQSTMGGLADKVTKYFDALPGKISKSQAQLRDSILAQFDGIARSLDTQADKRAQYLKDLDAEKTKLDAAKDARTSYAKSILEGVTALGDVTKVKAAEGEALRAGDLISNLQGAVNNTKEFKGLFDQLKSMGLDQTTLAQITAAYQQSGDLSFARTIADGGQNAINQITSLQGQLKSAGTLLGTDTSKTFFDSGVQVAQGLVNGVKSQISQVEDAMEAIAKRMTKKIKKALGIKSPSTVFKGLGRYTVQGLEAGLSAPNNVTSIMDRLSTQVTDGYGASLDSSYSASGAGGNTINVTVNAPVGSNPVEIGRSLQGYLDDYSRISGKGRAA